MPVAIKNLTQWPIHIPLNSGTHLRLSPDEVAADIHDVEVKDNAKVEKLMQQHVIAVEREDDEDDDAGEDGVEKKRPRRARSQGTSA